jgi:hypothetical protein
MKLLAKLFVLSCLSLIFGCGTTGKFVYPDKMTSLVKISSESMVKKSVAVVPFDDYRSTDNSCCYPLYLIPLMPFGWADYERPEAASMYLSIWEYDATPSEDLAKATALSLRRSNIFNDAFFTMGGEKQNADFLLTGEIKTFKYEGKMWSYGLSTCCPVLWLLGAPSGTSENKLEIDLQLKNKNGKVLWDWSISKEDWIVQWHYARAGHDCKMFSRLYQEAMNEAMKDLAEKIQENPNLFN